MHMISKTQQVFVKYMDHISNPVTRGEAELVAVSGVQDSYLRCVYDRLPAIHGGESTFQVRNYFGRRLVSLLMLPWVPTNDMQTADGACLHFPKLILSLLTPNMLKCLFPTHHAQNLAYINLPLSYKGISISRPTKSTIMPCSTTCFEP